MNFLLVSRTATRAGIGHLTRLAAVGICLQKYGHTPLFAVGNDADAIRVLGDFWCEAGGTIPAPWWEDEPIDMVGIDEAPPFLGLPLPGTPTVLLAASLRADIDGPAVARCRMAVCQGVALDEWQRQYPIPTAAGLHYAALSPRLREFAGREQSKVPSIYCYESIYGGLAAALCTMGARVDIVTNRPPVAHLKVLHLMSRARIGVAPFGVTTLELAALGIPQVIVGHPEIRPENMLTTRHLVGCGAALSVPFNNKTALENAVGMLWRESAEISLRRRLAAVAAVPVNGAENLARLLISVASEVPHG